MNRKKLVILVLTLTMQSLVAARCQLGKPVIFDRSKMQGEVVLVSHDGSFLVSPHSHFNKVTLYDFNNGHITNATSYNLPKGAENPQHIALSNDDRWLVVSNSHTISFFKVEMRSLVNGKDYPIPENEYVNGYLGIAFTPDSSYVVASYAETDKIIVYPRIGDELGTYKEYTYVSGIEGPYELELFPDGRHIAVANLYSISLGKFDDGMPDDFVTIPVEDKFIQVFTIAANNKYVITGNGPTNAGPSSLTVFTVENGRHVTRARSFFPFTEKAGFTDLSIYNHDGCLCSANLFTNDISVFEFEQGSITAHSNYTIGDGLTYYSCRPMADGKYLIVGTSYYIAVYPVLE